jgi:hypothetical protein
MARLYFMNVIRLPFLELQLGIHNSLKALPYRYRSELFSLLTYTYELIYDIQYSLSIPSYCHSN